jgi:hypothetical protein
VSGFILALGFIAIVVGFLALIPAMLGMLQDWSDVIVTRSFSVAMTGIILGCVFLLTGLLLGGSKPELVEGRCYQAVKHGSYVPITVSTGKSVVIVPSYTESIDLVEVRCE